MSYLQTKDGSEESQGRDDGGEDVSFLLVLGNSHQHSQEDGKTTEMSRLRSSNQFYVQFIRKLLFLVWGFQHLSLSVFSFNS